MSVASLRIGWVLQSASFDLASVRYRCFYVAHGLSRFGCQSRFFTELDEASQALGELDALVIVKRLDGQTMKLAGHARAVGVPVVFDLCDDVISPGYRANEPHLNLMLLAAVASVADAIVTTGPALTARVRERLPSSPEIVEIPDVCETPELIEATRALVALLQAKPASPALRARLRNIRRSPRAVAATLRTRARKIWRGNPKVVAARYYLSRSAYGLRHPDRAVRRVLVVAGVMRDHPKAPEDAFEPLAPPPPPTDGAASAHQCSPTRQRVVWFGNHGAPHSNFGMLSLLSAGEALQRVNRDHPLELVVISSNLRKFNALAAALGVPARYVAWSAEAVHQELSHASVALLTSGDDSFSEVKSANRTVVALQAGTPVVAPMAAALEPLRHCIATDFEAGLRRYLSDPAARAHDVAQGRAVIHQVFGLDEISRQWREVLSKARSGRLSAQNAARPATAYLIESDADLQAVLSAIDADLARGAAPNVIVGEDGAIASPAILQALAQRRVIPTMVGRDDVGRLDRRWLRNSDVLVVADGAQPIAKALDELAKTDGLTTVVLSEAKNNDCEADPQTRRFAALS